MLFSLISHHTADPRVYWSSERHTPLLTQQMLQCLCLCYSTWNCLSSHLNHLSSFLMLPPIASIQVSLSHSVFLHVAGNFTLLYLGMSVSLFPSSSDQCFQEHTIIKSIGTSKIMALKDIVMISGTHVPHPAKWTLCRTLGVFRRTNSLHYPGYQGFRHILLTLGTVFILCVIVTSYIRDWGQKEKGKIKLES